MTTMTRILLALTLLTLTSCSEDMSIEARAERRGFDNFQYTQHDWLMTARGCTFGDSHAYIGIATRNQEPVRITICTDITGEITSITEN